MDQQSNSESRRKFLKTAGKFAVYTPPALMLMSKSSHATFSKSGGYGDKDHKKDDHKGGYGDGNRYGYYKHRRYGRGLLGRLFGRWFSF